MKENNSSKKKPALKAGVYRSTRKNGSIYYRSSLTYRMKHISLGSFPTEQKAHRAYEEGRKIVEHPGIDVMSYRSSSPLPFEKWVILLNFRDHGIYISNPIYLGQRLFYYYLSPDEVMKFDMDDLFYYSSHCISRRGGHFYIADYGSQISLLSRYGIKAYSVPEVDYRFLNGDNLDFRRENLEIRNTYHGVRPDKEGKFLARIHVNGYLKIGRYDSALQAAIAYNKAIDILKTKGIKKNFINNYIDEVSPRIYAEIYSSLRISDSVSAFRLPESI